MQLETLEGDGKRNPKKEDLKDGDDLGKTNFPDDGRPTSKGKINKVAPAGGATDKKDPEATPAEEEEEVFKTEEDDPKFIRRLGEEPYIRFADFAKYLSLFNSRTGLDEKIQCNISKNIALRFSLLSYI